MDSISGVCPNCQEEGPLGAACPEKGCQRRGYHFIPEWASCIGRSSGEPNAAAALGLRVGEVRTTDVSGLVGWTTSDVVGHRREASASTIPRETGRSVTPRRTLPELPEVPDAGGPVDGGEAQPREPGGAAERAPATGRVDDWSSPAPPRRTRRWLVPAIAIAAAVGGAGVMALVGPSGGESGEPDAKEGVVATVREADAGPAVDTNTHEPDTVALTEHEHDPAALTEAAETENARTPSGYVRIEPGSFEMGSPSTESGHEYDETQHRVRISRAYWLKSTVVTQGEWKERLGRNARESALGCAPGAGSRRTNRAGEGAPG